MIQISTGKVGICVSVDLATDTGDEGTIYKWLYKKSICCVEQVTKTNFDSTENPRTIIHL